MSKYKSKSNQKYLGLLNFEGDIFRAYKESETKYVIVDDNREVILNTDSDGVLNILSGKICLTTSEGRTYNISLEHTEAKPKQKDVNGFLGLLDEDDLELWESVQYRIREEGIDYCFEHYSNWNEIKNKKFHQLREQFLKNMVEMREYVNNKVDELRNQ